MKLKSTLLYLSFLLVANTLNSQFNPIVHYALDNSSVDSSGGSDPIALYNGTSFSPIHKYGTHALQFDGVNDYAVINKYFTHIAFWVKAEPKYNIITLLANTKSGLAPLGGAKFFVNSYNTQDRRLIFEYTGFYNNLIQVKSDPGIFEFSKWNYIVVNKLFSNLYIYYNGTLVAYTMDDQALVATDLGTDLHVGIMTDNKFPLKGMIDDIKLYYDYSTRHEEIYNIALAGGVLPPGPAAPSNLKITDYTSYSAKLSWTDNSNNEDGFILDMQTDSTYQIPYKFAVVGPNITWVEIDKRDMNGRKLLARSFKNNVYSRGSNSVTLLSPEIPQEDFIAHWSMDNTYQTLIINPADENTYTPGKFIPDISGHYRDLGINDKEPVFSTDRKEGNYSVNPLNEKIRSNPNDEFGQPKEFSIILWAKVNSAWNIQTLVANTRSGNYSGFKLMVNTYLTSDQKLIVETGDGIPSSSVKQTASKTGVFKPYQWNQVGLVVNKNTGSIKLYNNGNLVASSTGMSNSVGLTGLWYGSMNQDFPNFFPLNGLLDDIKIYPRALSDSEVKTIFTGPIAKQNSMLSTRNVEDPDFQQTIENDVKLYPNPFKDLLTVSGTNIRKIELIDIAGKTRLELNATDYLEDINTRNLEPGIYFTRVIFMDGSSKITKVAKQ